MVKDIGFRIKIPLAKETTDSQKGIDKFRKGFVDLEKKEIPKLHRTTKNYLGDTKKGLGEAGKAAEGFGRTLSYSMEHGLKRVSEFNEKLHRTRERIFGIKEAFEATLVGGAAFWAGEKLLEGGRAGMRVKKRVGREFGEDAEFINGMGEKLGRRAGIEGAEATRALIPLAESLQQIQAGSQFRGMKGKLTASQAEGLRKKNMEFGATLIQRMAVLSPDVDSQQVGEVMNDAMSGPEGIRRMIAAFHMSRHSKKLSEMNEKGEAFQALTPAEQKKLGITKKGQYLEQGDLVKLMMERSGYTAKATEDEMKTLDFQIKAIGASMKTTFGEIGEGMMSKLDGGLNKGATLSQRFNTYLDANKETIKHIGEGLGSAAQAVGSLASKLPAVGAFLSEHKTLLLSLGAGFVGFKALSGIGGMLDGAKKIPGVGGLLGEAKGVGIPVMVTNWPGGEGGGGGMGGAGKGSWVKNAAKYGLGGAAGAVGSVALLTAGVVAVAAHQESQTTKLIEDYKKNNPVDLETRRLFGEDYARDHHAVARRGVMTMDPEAIRAGLRDLGGAGGQPVQVTTNVQLDGRTIAKVVSEHQARGIRTATANGAAPIHRE